ncbi:MAG: hypothetical protein OXU75_19410 [Deltaproteobacteria bacterium]|nr:hypothetical protein [Deltaproteobacteria bacterium]
MTTLRRQVRKRIGCFLLALRDVAKARGIRQLAKDTHLSRESLYRTLSQGYPRISTLEAVLESLGPRLSVEVIADAKVPPGRAGAAL